MRPRRIWKLFLGNSCGFAAKHLPSAPEGFGVLAATRYAEGMSDVVETGNPVHAEISYDLVMEDEMDFVEGTYRLPGNEWQVFIFSPATVTEMQVTHGTWDSGVTGVFIRFPEFSSLDKQIVERILGDALGVQCWTEVRGPDSMQLR
jgi:hypothetical protein